MRHDDGKIRRKALPPITREDVPELFQVFSEEKALELIDSINRIRATEAVTLDEWMSDFDPVEGGLDGGID